jgi:hypothetical protein
MTQVISILSSRFSSFFTASSYIVSIMKAEGQTDLTEKKGSNEETLVNNAMMTIKQEHTAFYQSENYNSLQQKNPIILLADNIT